MKKNFNPIVDFLFEVGILSKTPRSGFYFLGSGEQSVSEHTCRVVYIGYVLAALEKKVDNAKVMKMCLFHDLAEARTSDLNYIHQKYAQVNDNKATQDLTTTMEFGHEISEILKEYTDRRTKEAKLAKDADQLEWILSLKEQVDIGNARSKTWLPSAIKRLKTGNARQIAERITKTDSDHWWFADKDDDWWVTKNKK